MLKMKKIIFLILLFTSISIFGQEPKATTFFYKKVTTTQRDAIDVSNTNQVGTIYNLTTDRFEHYNGSEWIATLGITAANITLDDTDLVVVTETNLQAFADGVDHSLLKVRGTGVNTTYVSTVAVGGTTFAQPAVFGEIKSDEGYFDIHYTGATGVAVANLNVGSTYIYISNTGTLQQQTSTPTRQDWTRKIFTMRIGVDVVSNTIIGFEYLNNPIGNNPNSTRDLYSYLKATGIPLRKGQLITGRATDLGFDVSAGSIFKFGSTGDINNPNTPNIAQEDNPSYNLMSRTNFVSSETNLVKFWDNNGVITALGSTTFVGHRLFRFTNGNFAMQYGQGNYANITLAKAGVLLEDYVLNPALEEATFFGWWLIEDTATNTGGTTLTDFVEYTIGVQGGSSSSLSGALLKGNNLSDLLDMPQTLINLGLGNIDNTSDLDKPISTSQQTALDLKVTGPASAVDENIAIFDSTTGKLIKDSGINKSAIIANTAKVSDINHNVTTNLTKTVTANDVTINSSDGDNIPIGAATTSVAGVMTKSLYDNVIANNSKTGITTTQANDIITNNAKVSDINHNTDTQLSKSDIEAFGFVDGAHTVDTNTQLSKSDIEAFGFIDNAQPISEKNANSGYAGLDSSGKINPNQLPSLAITNTYVVASQTAMLALSIETGDVAIRTDVSKTYILQGDDPTVLADWAELLAPTDAVSSVFGRSGVVTAQANDYTFAQLDNIPTTVSGYNITDFDTEVSNNTSVAANTAKVGITPTQASNIVTNNGKVSNITQTSIVGITGTKAQFDTAVTDGNIMYDGDAYTKTEADGKYLLNTTDTLDGNLTVTGDVNLTDATNNFIKATNATAGIRFLTGGNAENNYTLQLGADKNSIFWGGLTVINNVSATKGLFDAIGVGVTTLDASNPLAQISGTIMSSSSSLTAAPTIASIIMDYHSSSSVGRVMAGSAGLWDKNLALNPYGGNVGVGTTTPLAVNGGVSTKLHAKGAILVSEATEVGRFEGGLDGDGASAIVRINTSNDRGLYLEGGRKGVVGFGAIGTTDASGIRSEAILIDNVGNIDVTGSVTATNGIFSGDVSQGDFSTSSLKSFYQKTNKSIFSIITDGTANAAGTTINYSWANGGQGSLKFDNSAGTALTLAADRSATFASSLLARKLVIAPSAQDGDVDGLVVAYNDNGASASIRAQMYIDSFNGQLELKNGSDVITAKISSNSDSYLNGGDLSIGNGDLDVSGSVSAGNGNFSGTLTLNKANSGVNSYHSLDRNLLSTENMFKWSTGGTNKWYLGQRSLGAEKFSLFSSTLGADVFTFTETGAATFASSVSATDAKLGGSTSTETLGVHNSSRPYIHLTSDTTGKTGADGTFIGFVSTSGALEIRNKENQPINFKTNDIQALTLASNQSATFASSVSATDGIFSNNIFIDTENTAANPRLYFRHDNLDVSNFIEVDRNTGDMEFWNNGSLAFDIATDLSADFASSVNAEKLSIYTNENSAWSGLFQNLGSTNAHGVYVNIGASSTGIPFRVDKNGSSLFDIANSGEATFSGITNVNNRLNVSKSLDTNFLSFFQNTSTSGHGLLIQAGGTVGERYIIQALDALGNSRLKFYDTGEFELTGNLSANEATFTSSVSATTLDLSGAITLTHDTYSDWLIKKQRTNGSEIIGIRESTVGSDKLALVAGNLELLTLDGTGHSTFNSDLSIVGSTLVTDTVDTEFISRFINQSSSGDGLFIEAGGTSGTRYIIQAKDALGNVRLNFHDTGEFELTGSVSATDGDFSGNLKGTNIITVKGVSPYYQWENAAGTRLGYLQHNGTDLVLNADVGLFKVNQATEFASSVSATDGIFSGNTYFGTTATPNGTSVYGSAFIDDSADRATLFMASSRSTAAALIVFNNPNGLVGTISTNGSSTSYNTTSDYRLKEDLQDFNGLEMISNIPVYDYKWKVDESRSYGVMAHELQAVLPNAVTGEKDAEEMQAVDYSKIVPLLIKSIQELKAEIELLKNK